MSLSNSYIAVGLGVCVHLFRYNGCHKQWHIELSIPDFTRPIEVKFQVLSFSIDNTTLTVSTQRYDQHRSPDDDAISTYVWECRQWPAPPRIMNSCTMPTVSPLSREASPS
jgi:hypothetical protein